MVNDFLSLAYSFLCYNSPQVDFVNTARNQVSQRNIYIPAEMSLLCEQKFLVDLTFQHIFPKDILYCFWSYEYMKIIYENCGVKNYMKEDNYTVSFIKFLIL